jgi:2-iminoacetate synthase
VSFREYLETVPIEELLETANTASDAEIDLALSRERLDLHDVAALLSPRAAQRLEEMARLSHEITTRRFGRTIQLYAPLYVSNECVETCTYCSFARENPIRRRTLSVEEVAKEAEILVRRGFRHLLIVSGEHPRHVSPAYIAEILGALRDTIPSLSVEVQPQEADVYRGWIEAGAEGLVVYQETYDRDVYRGVHLAGKKKNYDWRLEAPERGGEAGMKRLGIGALFGLADWRFEAIHLAAHARHLMHRFWKAFVSVSFPRLQPAAFAISAPKPVRDQELVQLVCAFRMFLPDLGLVLSTRESAALRDGMLPLGITQMSAGSRTEPGGYSDPEESGAQFSVEDHRDPEEISRVIRDRGFDPVWKDWEVALHG